MNPITLEISNCIPTGRVIGTTPDGRKAGAPLKEGVSHYAGTGTDTPLAAIKSAAKMNPGLHSGDTLLNLILNHNLVSTPRVSNEILYLLVRVAGYSTQFVNFLREIQDTIIARNTHCEF